MSKKTVVVVSAVIQRGDTYLISQRMEKAVLPLLWEFPGGKVEEGETPEQALRRELKYRLGVEIAGGEEISVNVKDYGEYSVELHLFACSIDNQEPQALQVRDLKWVTSAEFASYEFPPADKVSMDQLLSEP